MFDLPPTPFTFQDKFPEIAGVSGQWQAAGTEKRAFTLAGTSGEVEERKFICGDIVYTAVHFCASDDSFHAFRGVLHNSGAVNVAVESAAMCSFSCNPDSREYFCMKRLKAEKPYSAFYHGENFEADNVVIFHSDGKMLLFGFLDQHRHLSSLKMSDRTSILIDYFNSKLFTASADYDGTVLNAGQTWETQWCEVFYGDDFNAMLKLHAQRATAVSGIAPRNIPSPFVASSWHYFAGHISENMLATQLQAIRERKIPAEVYQFDGGWYEDIGCWKADKNKFPNGMKKAADMIRAAGMIPGIWLAPFIICVESATAQAHPEWLLRNRDGEIVPFRCSRPCAALDLSRQDVLDYIEKTFRELREMGYTFFKADFTQALFMDPHPAPHDRSKNILECFRAGLLAIRRGIGEESFFNLCGGHTGAAMGIADSQRTGHDTYARWTSDNPAPAWHRIRQCMFRAWMGAWRHNDPDAITIRLNNTTLDNSAYGPISLGDMNDDEARTMVLHQFLAGGAVAFGEKCRELSDERLQMIPKVAPSAGKTAELLDPWNCRCPEKFLTRISSAPGNPEGFNIYSQINTSDETAYCIIRLTPRLTPPCKSGKFAVADADSQEVLGIFPAGAEVRGADIPPHGSRVLRIVPVPEERTAFPVISDGHYAGTELTAFNASGRDFTARIHHPWQRQLQLTAALPGTDGQWEFAAVSLSE